MTEEKNSIPLKHSKLAKDLLKIVAQSDIRLGDMPTSDEDKNKMAIIVQETSMKMTKLLYKNNILECEVSLINELMLQAITWAYNGTIASIEKSKDIANKNLWGKYAEDITLKDINEKMANSDK